MNHLDSYITAKAALTARFTPAQLHGHQRAARTRLREAHRAHEFARDTFDGFPGDVSAEGVRDALTEVEDAEALAREWAALGELEAA